jgi:hypothetical protein
MAFAWRATPIWIPVVHGRRVIGEVRGDPDRGRTLIRCAQGIPYNTYDSAVVNKSAGKHYALYWTKGLSSTAVIDNWYDLWGVVGNPQPGDWSGTALTARRFTNATTGALNTGNAVSPSIKYITRASGYSLGTIQAALIYDRVLSYDACTMTAGSQSMVNTLAATRYISTGDPGLQIFIEVVTVHSATAANLTVVTYVNQAGTGGQVVPTTPTLTVIPSVAAPTATLGARGIIQQNGIATKNQGQIYLNLAAGDQGIRSITNFTFSAAPTGTNSFVLQAPLALFADMATPGQCFDADFIFGLEVFNKRVYDDACLSVLYNPHVATNTSMHGWSEFGWT